MTRNLANLPRVGLICVDPLRILGLQTLLQHGVLHQVAVLEGTRSYDLGQHEVVIVDSTSTANLLPLIGAMRRICPRVRVLVLGVESDEAHTEAVIGAGAQGYLCHRSSEAALVSALAVVREGSIWAPRRVLARLLEQARGAQGQAEGETPSFTPREIEILRLLVQGKSNREIGIALTVAETTVKSHLARLMRKTGVWNRTALTMRALDSGWVASRNGTRGVTKG